MESCSLCSPDLGPVLATSQYWRLILNHNQNLVGKCFLVLCRHLEAVSQLDSSEWQELHPRLSDATRALQHAFQPDHFNYAFLQNQDRHIHMHIIPRYASPRQFKSLTFADPDYPSHYAVPGTVRQLVPADMADLAAYIRRCSSFE